MKAQKMKLSGYWWANFWFLFGLTIAAELGFLMLLGEVLLLPMELFPLIFLVGALHPWRFLMTMESREGGLPFLPLWAAVLSGLYGPACLLCTVGV